MSKPEVLFCTAAVDELDHHTRRFNCELAGTAEAEAARRQNYDKQGRLVIEKQHVRDAMQLLSERKGA